MGVTLQERFWSKVDRGAPSECWMWRGTISTEGYGTITERYKRYGAHRLAWQFENNVPIPAGHVVCHSCDNPACVNPDHLWVGSQADNMRDMSAKGRAPGRNRTACPAGHAYSPENTYVRPDGSRTCRACNCQSVKAYKLRRSA